MSTNSAPVDKARQQLMARIAEADREIDEALKGFANAQDQAESLRDRKALQAKIDTAARTSGPAATKALVTLHKQALALAGTIRQRSYDLFARRRRIELVGQVRAALAAALLDVGSLKDPVLTKMVFAEQAAMKARFDKAEAMKRDLEAVGELDDIDDEMPVLRKRIDAAMTVSAWLSTGYRSMVALTRSSIDRIGSERVRRMCLAELDFVEADKNAALGKLETRAVENAVVPALKRISTVASRVAAAGPVFDRELMRVGGAIKAAGAPSELTARLKKLASEKAAGWPQATEIDAFAKVLDAFGKELADLAAVAERATKARAPAAAH